MQTIVFEDAAVRQLVPISLGRPAYSIRCGDRCLAEALGSLPGTRHGRVRPELEAWQSATFPHLEAATLDGPTLLVNARLVPSPANLQELARMARGTSAGWVESEEQLVAAWLPHGERSDHSALTGEGWREAMRRAQADDLTDRGPSLTLFRCAHEVVHYHQLTFNACLQERIAGGGYREVRDGVFVEGGSPLPEMVSTDTRCGPIVLDHGVEIRPFAYLMGPLYVGRNSRINEHAAIKSGVSAGAQCKLGGEIDMSVIEANTSKQHYGYLGHSYLGEWVNLGAGTSNSNLKNTYGTVRVTAGDRKIDTGRQFVGCVVGDGTKTAINTGIFTGKSIGAHSMVYGMVTEDVPSFVNYAKSWGQIGDLPAEVVAQTQRRAMLRRGHTQQPWQVELIARMYEVAAAGRSLSSAPLSL